MLPACLLISRLLHLAHFSMEDVKKLSMPNVSEDFTESADAVLVLDDGKAIPCHSQLLLLHSAVLRNMFADLPACKHDKKTEIPLKDFTEAQCSALLAYFYSNGVYGKGAAFAKHIDAAVDVARFAHTYNAPHALQQVQAYLIAFLDESLKVNEKWTGFVGKSSLSDQQTGKLYENSLLDWALMADRYDMPKLCGHCERTMVQFWNCFHDKPELIVQLSSGALKRIAKGLSRTLLAPRGKTPIYRSSGKDDQYPAKEVDEIIERARQNYPDVDDFIAWRQEEQLTAHPSGIIAST